jgi:hypothetical protein
MWFFGKKEQKSEDPNLYERVRKLESRVLILESDLIGTSAALDTIRSKFLKRFKEQKSESAPKDLYSQVLLPPE